MAKLKLKTYSYRFAEEVLNSNLSIKKEIEEILLSDFDESLLTRPGFNRLLESKFDEKNWILQPPLFDEVGDPATKMDFMKSRLGVEVQFGHASFIGIDLLKFQIASYSGLNKIDIGIYIVTTKQFQNSMKNYYNHNWDGSLTFEKVAKYLPQYKSAIQVPIYVIGIDI